MRGSPSSDPGMDPASSARLDKDLGVPTGLPGSQICSLRPSPDAETQLLLTICVSTNPDNRPAGSQTDDEPTDSQDANSEDGIAQCAHPSKGFKRWRIGKTSRVFRTTDTRHSDNYAPTGLLGPFRGEGCNARAVAVVVLRHGSPGLPKPLNQTGRLSSGERASAPVAGEPRESLVLSGDEG
jgi:hypothetical protein